MLNEVIFLSSIVSYFLLEKYYQLGVIIALLCTLLSLSLKSHIGKALAILFLAIHVAFVMQELSTYAGITFILVAIVYPVFYESKKSVSKVGKKDATIDKPKTKASEPIKAAQTPISKSSTAAAFRLPAVFDDSESESKALLTTPVKSALFALKTPSTGNIQSPTEYIDPIKKAIESARKRELERKETARQRALGGGYKHTPVKDQLAE